MISHIPFLPSKRKKKWIGRQKLCRTRRSSIKRLCGRSQVAQEFVRTLLPLGACPLKTKHLPPQPGLLEGWGRPEIGTKCDDGRPLSMSYDGLLFDDGVAFQYSYESNKINQKVNIKFEHGMYLQSTGFQMFKKLFFPTSVSSL